MKRKAVIDRIEDGKHAVLLLEPDEKEMLIQLERLPKGIKPGYWLEVTLQDGEIKYMTLLTEETEARERLLAEKMSLLRTSGSSLKRKK